MTDVEFAEIVALGHERTGVEFKASGPLNARKNSGIFVAQVVKAILGMANRRDGGSVVIGVADNDGSPNPVGVAPNELATWKYDRLADQVANYADPDINFELEIREYNGGNYVVILVEEFDDIPVLCKRDYSYRGTQDLREGACYVRSRRKPETSEIPTQADMRDLLNLAVEKRFRQELDWARRVGLFSPATLASSPNDQERFESQLGDLI